MGLGTLLGKVTGYHRVSHLAGKQASQIQVLPVYFELTCLSSDEKSVVSQIESGNEYVLQVCISGTPQYMPDIQQNPCYINSDLQLELKIQELSFGPIDLEISPATQFADQENLSRRTYCGKFKLTVGVDCPNATVNLQLLFRENTNGALHIALSQSLRVKGCFSIPEPDFRKACNVKLDQRPPEEVAIVHVIPAGRDCFQLVKWHSQDAVKKSLNIPNQEIGLANFIQGRIQPDAILNNARLFSQHDPGQFISWLTPLYQKYQTNLVLLVVDHTNFEIPWELVELDDGQYIGALIKIVRWATVKMYTEEMQLTFEEEKIEGRILGYLSDDIGIGASAEEKINLSHFKSQIENNLINFQTIIAQSTTGVGLVYYACHGIFSHRREHELLLQEKIQAGILAKPFDTEIHFIDFESMPKFGPNRPLFIINACHSARIFTVGGADEEKRTYGLPPVLLARAARGYIGTTGPVGTMPAALIMKFILSHLKNGESIAEILRKLREYAVRQAKIAPTQDKKDESLLFMIYTFMYVFYGNPALSVKVLS